ncbi:hypothetical protein ACLB1E_34205 [Escherichia coli]
MEQKNYVHFGLSEESHWRKSSCVAPDPKLQNPFKQNQGRIRAIQSALKARELECINVVIINGRCKFDGIKPEWLCMGMDDFIHKVKQRRGLRLFTPESVARIVRC